MIIREDLEKWNSVNDARKLVETYFNDKNTYPDKPFYSRKRGIYKDIPEEYHSLVVLAEHIKDAYKLRLLPSNNQGADGEIRLTNQDLLSIQITNSHENKKSHLKRKTIDKKGVYCDNKAVAIEKIIKERLRRIWTAIEKKNFKDHSGTDILLIQEESIAWSSELKVRLKNKLKTKILKNSPSQFKAIYINFYETPFRLY